ncbi:MAG TPA: hypothetical protein GXZ58_01580 [Bacilli bacterium]|nr:hypothetical protein [Bacilli bacterium]
MAVSQWIQFIGQFTEVIDLSQLAKLQPESKGEKTNVAGQWIQTLAQAIEAVGATTQGLTRDEKLLVEALIEGMIEDALQTVGNAMQVVANKEFITGDLRTYLDELIDKKDTIMGIASSDGNKIIGMAGFERIIKAS